MNLSRHETASVAQGALPPYIDHAVGDGRGKGMTDVIRPNAIIECGWGRLLFGPSFDSPQLLAQTLLQEEAVKRDIALHVEAPQLVLAEAPSRLFLDPSLIFRRALDDAPTESPAPGVVVRQITTRADIAAINRLYKMRAMVPVDPLVVWQQRHSQAVV